MSGLSKQLRTQLTSSIQYLMTLVSGSKMHGKTLEIGGNKLDMTLQTGLSKLATISLIILEIVKNGGNKPVRISLIGPNKWAMT